MSSVYMLPAVQAYPQCPVMLLLGSWDIEVGSRSCYCDETQGVGGGQNQDRKPKHVESSSVGRGELLTAK